MISTSTIALSTLLGSASAQNFSLDEVDKGLRHGAAGLVKAGFNVHGDQPEPDIPLDQLI
ncbi:hypothetical protein SLS60_008988 [Paraconiothyrium brasiliense]|uniref:Uncharacterized protein n=1 Tax=Paraconiothyrium brasiliense TaxID=300254 RepID=A0ABR3QWE8_9PLEO